MLEITEKQFVKMDLELPNRLYKCVNCSKLFDCLAALDTHTFQHTGEKAYTCDLCQKKFISLKNCKLHVSNHIDDDIDMIDDNGNGKLKEASMVYLDKDGEEMSQCDLCGEIFKFERHCRFHILSHLGGNTDIDNTQTHTEEQAMNDLGNDRETAPMLHDISGQRQANFNGTRNGNVANDRKKFENETGVTNSKTNENERFYNETGITYNETEITDNIMKDNEMISIETGITNSNWKHNEGLEKSGIAKNKTKDNERVDNEIEIIINSKTKYKDRGDTEIEITNSKMKARARPKKIRGTPDHAADVTLFAVNHLEEHSYAKSENTQGNTCSEAAADSSKPGSTSQGAEISRSTNVRDSTSSNSHSDNVTANQHQKALVNETICKICKKEFVNAHQMKLHFNEMHRCEFCTKILRAETSRFSHMKTCHPEQESDHFKKCHVCKANFRNESGYKIHMERLHPNEVIDWPKTPFQCNECKKYFSTAPSLKYHRNLHTGDKPFPCDVCSKSFSHPSDLHRHYVIHTGDRPYKCFLCQKDFSRAGNLNRHMLTHEKLLPFSCKFCRKKFKTLKLMKNHEAICQTSKSKQFSCTTCGHLFKEKCQLKSHLLTHAEPRFHCEICNRRFTQRKSLRDHLTTHSSVKEHKCNECQAEFRTKSSLRAHQRKIHESGMFERDICDRMFTLRSALEDHEALHESGGDTWTHW